MASGPASKQKSSDTTAQIFKRNGCREEKKSKKIRQKVGVEKSLGRRKTTGKVSHI